MSRQHTTHPPLEGGCRQWPPHRAWHTICSLPSLLLGLPLGLLLAATSGAETLRVASAANFRAPLQEIVAGFESATPYRVKISTASTGVIYSQIRHGAPFDLFLAADSRHPQLLAQQGLVSGQPRTYAWGRLVLAYRAELAGSHSPNRAGLADSHSPNLAERVGSHPPNHGGSTDSPMPKRAKLTDSHSPRLADLLTRLLTQPGLSLAIAHPTHAPYGIAARETLAHFDTALKLVRGANVGQAFGMWHSGNTDMALVAAVFVPEPHIPVPQHLYTPLQQQAVVLRRTPQPVAAGAFLDYLTSEPSRRVVQRWGYGVGDGVIHGVGHNIEEQMKEARDDDG